MTILAIKWCLLSKSGVSRGKFKCFFSGEMYFDSNLGCIKKLYFFSSESAQAHARRSCHHGRRLK